MYVGYKELAGNTAGQGRGAGTGAGGGQLQTMFVQYLPYYRTLHAACRNVSNFYVCALSFMPFVISGMKNVYVRA